MKKDKKKTNRQKQSKPQIFAFHDYRMFLQSWFEFKRSTQPHFSMRQLAQLAGLATGYLPMVIAGQRTLSADALEKLLPFLGLTSQEKTYLELLRRMSDSPSSEARKEALERIQKFKGYRSTNHKETEAYKYLTHWYYVAIREMAALPEFKADPAWIQQRLRQKIPLSEIESALKFLSEGGFLKISKTGDVHPLPEKAIECIGGVYRVALGQFHKEMFKLAGESIDRIVSDERAILGNTVAVRSEDIDKIKSILNEAQNKIRELTEQQRNGEEVYHVSLVAFPLTKKGVL